MTVKKMTWLLLAGGLLGGTVAAQGPLPAIPADKDIVAEVSGKWITRHQLGEELLVRKGRAQLDVLVHRTLVEQACQAKGITVNDKEVQQELIAEMKASASANLMDFEKSRLTPRGIRLFEYREDTIRPRLMIQKLAASQITVTEEDLNRQFISRYGARAVIRMIQFRDKTTAQKVWSDIKGNADMFVRYAKTQENQELASMGGMMNPFGRYTTHSDIEKTAFNLKDNEISEILQTPEKFYVIIMKVSEVPARTDVKLADKIDEIRLSVLEKKRQSEEPRVIAELKKQASTCIKIYLGNENVPKANKDIVAEVNGRPITRQQLVEELIARKGRAQLEALIHRTVIEQTCQAKGITVGDKEVQEELIGKMKASSSANLLDFEKSMLTPRRTSLFEYQEDVIRPELMIQKLAASQLTVTEEDLKHEFISRYGTQAVVRMIQFKDERMAKKIWTEIGNNPDVFIRYAKIQENADLASVAGELSPFGRHTTYDAIEQRAFELKENEISEVMQAPEKAYVIIMKVKEVPARTDVTLAEKMDEVRMSALEKKRQNEVPRIMKELKNQAGTRVKIHLGGENDPQALIEKYQGKFGGDSK